MYREKQQFKVFVVFSPIFVADTKIIFGYNLVAPLKTKIYKLVVGNFHGAMYN